MITFFRQCFGPVSQLIGAAGQLRNLRGQVLVCERVKPFLKYPSVQIRQVGEGAVQIGDSKEDVGFDEGTRPQVISAIARRAVRIYPLLEQVRVVRTWGALRVMSPDGCPIYDRSTSCPGASLVTCHSGVTLAAAHALVLARWIAGEAEPDYVESLSAKRFQIQSAA